MIGYRLPLCQVLLIVLIVVVSIVEIKCALEEIEATPTSEDAISLGDLSMPQFIVLSVVFLITILLYAVGVLPIEVDLGFFYGTGSGSLLPRKFNDHSVSITRLVYDCPLQYVCDLDMWANKNDHEYFLEKLIASWFKNPNSKFSNDKSIAFGGVGSCREMYPCPFDIQELVGIRIPGSYNATMPFDYNDVDIRMDLTA